MALRPKPSNLTRNSRDTAERLRLCHRMRITWLVLALGLFTGQTLGEDWPQFRGPTGQGHSQTTGLPVKWSAKNFVWKKVIPGQGWSSPVLVQGKLYLTAAAPVGRSRLFDLAAICVDAAKGNVVWSTPIFRQSASSPAIHNKNSHASPTPIVEGSRLYVHFGHQGSACLDLNGKIIWPP